MRINITNRGKIEAALEAVNGRARSFTVESARQVEDYAKHLERELERRGVKKSERKGALGNCTPAGPTARAYKYRAHSTTIYLERGASGWFLIGVERSSVAPTDKEAVNLYVTPAQRDIILTKSMDGISVIAPSEEEVAA